MSNAETRCKYMIYTVQRYHSMSNAETRCKYMIYTVQRYHSMSNAETRCKYMIYTVQRYHSMSNAETRCKYMIYTVQRYDSMTPSSLGGSLTQGQALGLLPLMRMITGTCSTLAAIHLFHRILFICSKPSEEREPLANFKRRTYY